MSDSLDVTLKILRLLSHKVRNPLNVISNDINYLKDTYPSENCERSLARCRQIADFFKPVDLLESSAPDSFNLNDIIKEVFSERAEVESAFILNASFQNVRQALLWINELFDIETVTQENFFRFSLRDPIESGPLSISDLYAAKSGEENVIPLLIEAIIDSVGLKFSLGNSYFDLSRQ